MTRTTGLHLDPTSREPLYKQIFDQVTSRIRSNAFPAGYQLPPSRSLAGELETHRNTVVRAYAELEAAGFVTSTVGRGTFVAPQSPARARPSGGSDRASLPWASLLSRASATEPLRRGERLKRPAGARELINLTRMQPSDDLLPDELLRRCVDHVLRTQKGRALGYSPPEGLPRLRELICEDLAAQGVPATPHDILITTGSQQGLDLIARALVNPGDTFLVDSTTYSGAISLLTAAGARLLPVPSDDEGPEMAVLGRLGRSGAKGLYLMPNCHNPTGRTVSAARRRALVAWSHDHAVPLIEDDYGADLCLDDAETPPALRALDGEVLYTGTFSKKLVPALRVGFLVCPPTLRPTIVALKHAMDLGTSTLLQHTLAEFLERGYLRAHLNRTLPAYRERRDALAASLSTHLPPGMSFRIPSRGVVLWLELPEGIEPEVAFEEAHRRGVLVSPSTLNAIEAREQRGLRLTYCAEGPERLAEGGKRLGEALRAMRKQSSGSRPERADSALGVV